MKCIVVYNIETETVDFFWWCSTNNEYNSVMERVTKLYPKSHYEITTEYERSSYNLDNALGY